MEPSTLSLLEQALEARTVQHCLGEGWVRRAIGRDGVQKFAWLPGSGAVRSPTVSEAGLDGRFRLHHIGLAVPELDAAAKFLTAFLGYRIVQGPFEDPIQKVRVLFLTAAPLVMGPVSSASAVATELELVAPLTEDSPIRSLISTKGGGTYHSCFETTDLETAIADAQACGCVVVTAPAPAVAFGGRRIAWIYTPTRLLIELLEVGAGG